MHSCGIPSLAAFSILSCVQVLENPFPISYGTILCDVIHAAMFPNKKGQGKEAFILSGQIERTLEKQIRKCALHLNIEKHNDFTITTIRIFQICGKLLQSKMPC